ncbi:DUF551 domain-containing protein [Klebsiella pneumoniae]|uniref:DUF551 domain-containing protein n=1 Tax=Klebsiella pneumoniae TaxID=573 RepID=UPI001CF12D52|nr:DUF551 domain-containing protein [Klebsiella pneumoniae]MCA6701563.1 DUF551 domain-containing protein [Klebsiella pneumoniae]
MMELTKERLQQIVHAAGLEPWDYEEVFDGITTGEIVMMARQLLSGMEQEPVAWIAKSKATGEIELDEPHAIATNPEYWTDAFPVYEAPQLPQPAVAITQHFDTISLDTAKMVMCDVNRRDEFLGGDIQLLSRIQCRIDEACRAAMLQGAEPVQGWISCGEKMPVENDIVLVVDDGYFVCEAQYREGDFFSAARGKGEFFETTCRDVELWMPLPAAPQQEVK